MGGTPDLKREQPVECRCCSERKVWHVNMSVCTDCFEKLYKEWREALGL
jgi:hypothetical protein